MHKILLSTLALVASTALALAAEPDKMMDAGNSMSNSASKDAMQADGMNKDDAAMSGDKMMSTDEMKADDKAQNEKAK